MTKTMAIATAISTNNAPRALPTKGARPVDPAAASAVSALGRFMGLSEYARGRSRLKALGMHKLVHDMGKERRPLGIAVQGLCHAFGMGHHPQHPAIFR